ncbi:hypothetical protein MSPP1_003801 [Malassezia sp. CBS 17886]|nr:hypothetical protein MSPP1_003801 [Malassezia sp. CBS 17886]
MPTYADYFNQTYQGDVPSGPVRVTLDVSHADGAETRSVEELMDQVDNAEDAFPRNARAQGASPSRSHAVVHAWMQPLDTPNIILAHLDIVAGLVGETLDAAQSDPSCLPPVQLVVPHTVLDELDGLKYAERTLSCGARGRSLTAGAAARRASHWLLDTVQRQRYTPVADANLPPSHWIVHIEAAGAARRSYDADMTNDERIVSLCTVLTQAVARRIYLVSDDTNARTAGEVSGIPTVSLRTIRAALTARGVVGPSLQALWLHRVFRSPAMLHLLVDTEAIARAPLPADSPDVEMQEWGAEAVRGREA